MLIRSTWGTPPRIKPGVYCKRLDALPSIEKLCSSHFKLFCIVNSNTLWDRTVSSTCSSIVKLNSIRQYRFLSYMTGRLNTKELREYLFAVEIRKYYKKIPLERYYIF